MDRLQRAQEAAETLMRVHKDVESINVLGQYTDLLDHIARKVRVTRDEIKYLAAESRR